MGELTNGQLELSVDIEQSTWDGRIGIFFGFQQDQASEEPRMKYHVIELIRTFDGDYEFQHALRHFSLARPNGHASLNIAWEPVGKVAFRPYRMRLLIKREKVIEVSFDGKPLEAIIGTDLGKQIVGEGYSGHFGVYNLRSSGTFTKATINNTLVGSEESVGN